MSSFVICAGTDGRAEDVILFGPFEDDAWANAWLKQHNNDPSDTEDIGTRRTDKEFDAMFDRILKVAAEDPDHYCINVYKSDGVHTVLHTVVEPGLDPKTVAKYL